MKNKTAFVASTLPARFLLDNFERLGVGRVVCGSEALKLSYGFLADKFNIEVVSVPARSERNEFLFSEVSKCLSTGIVIFHECCWMELDLAIMKVQPPVYYFPCVTMEGFRKLAKEELGLIHLTKRVVFERTRSVLRLLWHFLKHGRKFDFYELTEDNEKSEKSYIPALKEGNVKNLVYSDEALKSRNVKAAQNDEKSKNIILITATDVIANTQQEKVFREVAEVCKKHNFNILVKDHPNPSARLNLKNLGRELSPYTPFEVLSEPYFMKIGLFSTTLIHEAEKSASIAELFQPRPDDFQARAAHLAAIPGGHSIKFLSSLRELEMILERNNS